jgi:UDP-GlcNAc:undecaprenyl-phosphate GlcNAc-1-phosphate transferase
MAGWLLSFFTSFFLSLFVIPVIIKVAKIKHLVDEPKEDRKVHIRSIPTVGGIGIFSSFLFALSFWGGYTESGYLEVEDYRFYQYFVASILLLFFVGLKDDIIGLSPLKKLIALLIVGIIMVFFAHMRIVGMEGLFGLHDLPFLVSVGLSLFTYIVVVNSVNLIDGIDGLAGGIGLVCGLAFGIWFFLAGNLFFAVLGFSLAGALLGFLFFNFTPAKIFMGDGGSLVVGFIICVLAMKMINYEAPALPESLRTISKPVLAMTILAYPLMDTFRVFLLRALKGKSPFSADKNHIHHRLIGKGYSHKKASAILYSFNVLLIGMVFLLRDLPATLAFTVMLPIAVLGTQVLLWLKPFKR